MVYLLASLKYLTTADYLNSSLSMMWKYTQMILNFACVRQVLDKN